MNDFKFKINEKVRNMFLIGTIIDATFNDVLGAVYLVRYEDGRELWAIESSLEKEEYQLVITYNNVFGGKGIRVFQIVHYDGDKQRLKEFINKRNEESGFWVTWRIINDETGIIEEEIDPLD